MSRPQILSVENVLNLNLSIPEYQRPYKWSTESAGILFDDILFAFSKNLSEYRIGSVILHKENDTYNVVDGQQRLTTLSILIICFSQLLGDNFNYNVPLFALNNNFSPLSHKAIKYNYRTLKNKCLELKGNNISLEDFANYVYKNCTFVEILPSTIQEAFQYFDSQNSRGKDLAPHDLLKSYHLRELDHINLLNNKSLDSKMNSVLEQKKLETIKNWENTDQDQLCFIFDSILFPLVSWYRYKNGLYFSSKKIKVFKGIKATDNFNFIKYHKNAHQPDDNCFQLSQPIIAGQYFFDYTTNYLNLYEKLRSKILNFLTEKNVPINGAGNSYIKNLFITICIFYVDKFSDLSLTPARLNRFFKWAYSLRLVMYAVYKETINNYALGFCKRINTGLNLFAEIADMQNPNELDLIQFQDVSKDTLKFYDRTEESNIDLFNIVFGDE